MKYTFTNMSTSGRPAWAAQHPDTVAVGFGRSKLRAIRHLEASRGDRRNTFVTFGDIPLTADGEIPASWRVTA